MITDNLPNEVNYVSSDGNYNPDTRTVTWNIDFPPSASGCVNLVAMVKHNVTPCSTITNYCQMRGDCIDINAYENTSVCCRWCPIYVDASATVGNNGYSWADAFTNLQDALKTAKDFNCNEILVAQGIYWPDINSAHPNGTGNRAATFQLINGVTIYGGFPAGGGTLEDRKPSVYETILSGDLLQNDRQVAEPCDLLNDPCRADNSYHVVTGSDTNATAILDGFTITGGDANSDYPYGYGGGMYNSNGSPTVRNCKFKWNSAQSGGGIYSNSYDSNTIITNCTFIENYGGSGGGIYIYNYSYPYVAKVTSCIFAGNYGGYGGGVFNFGNLAVTNCTFSGNAASSDYGGGIYSGYPGFTTVTNSIMWGNEGEQISGYANVTYSDIDGGWEGVGNIEEYPMFEADGYHLKMCSPCVDAGTNTPAGGLPATDIDGETRIMSGRCAGAAVVDMGADEYLPDCNALLYAHCRKPACNDIAGLYVGELPDVNLVWSPGRLAASHDVYFGTDYSEVDNATTTTPIIYKSPRQSAPNYLAVDLKAGATYYWRIDEVNDTNIWRGPVYSFRTGLFIDDFERYNSTDDVNANWPNNGYHPTGCIDPTIIGNAGLALIRDSTGKYLRYSYYHDSAAMGFSEAKRPYSGGVSFTGGGVIFPEPNTLRIDYLGSPTNAADSVYDRMYVAIEDTAGNVAVYPNPDPYAQQVDNWTSWRIALTDINALGTPHPVNLNAITGFAIGFGVRCDNYIFGGGDGNVMFDNIQLVPPYTPQGRQLTADFTCDCIVNFADFAIMGQEWLTSGIKADIYKDGNNRVDLMDLELLAEEWLK